MRISSRSTGLLGRRCYKEPIPHPRLISTSLTRCSGHNRWSKIGREKAKVDSAKSKQTNVLSHAITNASKADGADPKLNPQLADLMGTAKRMGMTKGSIESAILRGQGKSITGAALERVTIEAVVPPVAFIVEAQTDKKSQMLQEVRQKLRYHGGNATPTAYLFERRGRLTFEPLEGVSFDDVFDVALEAGALDVIDDALSRFVVDTDPAALKIVESALTARLDLRLELSETIWHPKSETMTQSLSNETFEAIEKVTQSLEQYPGVEGVFTNASLD